MLVIVIISGDGGGYMGLKLKKGVWVGDSDWVGCLCRPRAMLLNGGHLAKSVVTTVSRESVREGAIHI